MSSVIAEFEEGSQWDSRVLLLGIFLVISSFASTYGYGPWAATDRLFVPLLTAGVALVALNIAVRFFRPRLKVCILKLDGEFLEIRPVRNLQFSGWVALDPRAVRASDVARVNVFNFYTPATGAGMYSVSIELKDRKVVEYNLDSLSLVQEIVAFFETALPEVSLNVEKRTKA